MISNKMHKDLITKLMYTPLPKGIRTKGRGQGARETYGVLWNVGGRTEGGGAKSKNKIK